MHILKTLLNDFVPEAEIPELTITGLCSDSRHLKEGDIFFAYPGLNTDGRNFLRHISESGNAPAVVVCEKKGLEIYHETLVKLGEDIPVIAVMDLQSKISEIAARFYNYPSRYLTVIGVTGTNGKTSCTHFIAQILNQMNIRCAVMGTLGYGIPPHLSETQVTTQDAISVQKNLAELRAQKVEVVAMEVSSHGLDQHRIDAVEFTIAVLTQLSRDHLDYHETLEKYAQAKERLFHFASLKHIVVNLDDELGQHLVQTATVPYVGYSINRESFKDIAVENNSLVIADQIKLLPKACEVHVQTPWGKGDFKLSLLGRFNVSNSLAVLSALALLRLSFADILLGLEKLQTVNGRLQCFGGKNQPQVVVDYAHTPDALEKVLQTLREHCAGKLWCVFGCGGDRDRGKRALMAAIAERLSDHVVVTDDNPRSEVSEQIAAEIQQGFSASAVFDVILDRALAIKFAIQNAAPDDIILVAGKGHEEYQLIGSKRFYFSDCEQVKQGLMDNKL